MRVLLSLYLTLSMAGLPGVLANAFAAGAETGVPVVRHSPPTTPFPQTSMVIRAVIEDERSVASVRLWYRAKGASKYEVLEMTRVGGHAYESRLEVSGPLVQGVEYYVEAVDKSGETGTDGTPLKPYFVMVSERPSVESLSLKTTGETERARRPMWKNPWLWLGAALAVAGGIAIANGGTREDANTGTVVVE